MTPTRAQELAVLQAVIYASLFDYPLTVEQLQRDLVGVTADAETIVSWWRNSELLQATTEYRNGWFYPAGRSDMIATRARREALSRRLLVRDRRIISFVAGMPFVRMVALSGSLAHLNAEASADLDLFVITAPGRVWGVTLTVFVLSRLFGWRRRMCMNYIVSERAMTITPEDLFSANQIVHLQPVVGHDVFERFVRANGFVRDFYPNFAVATHNEHSHPARIVERVLSVGVAPIVERIARFVYGRHLRRRAAAWQSREQVRLEPECLKLHTSSHRAATLERFDRALATALARVPQSISVRAS